jgi:DnaJ-class molecular chaperone
MIRCPSCHGRGFVKYDYCFKCEGLGWLVRCEEKSSKDNGFRPVRTETVVSHEGRGLDGCGQTEQREFRFHY